MKTSAALKYTWRRMTMIRVSDLLITAVKFSSVNHKTKLIKIEKFRHKLKVIFFPAVKDLKSGMYNRVYLGFNPRRTVSQCKKATLGLTNT